jgi:hypothetical protein
MSFSRYLHLCVAYRSVMLHLDVGVFTVIQQIIGFSYHEMNPFEC